MALPPGYPSEARKFIVTSLLTPATFWGFEERHKSKSRDFEKMDELERELTRMYHTSIFGDVQHYTPVKNSLVAVLNPTTNLWVRGRIMSWNTQTLHGEVFLIDTGSHLSNVQLVRPLPPQAYAYRDQAVQIFLNGILPKTTGANHRQHGGREFMGQKWSARAMETVENLLTESRGVAVFTYARHYRGALIGDIYTYNEDKSWASSITQALIDEKCALYDITRFNNELESHVGKLILPPAGEEIRTDAFGSINIF